MQLLSNITDMLCLSYIPGLFRTVIVNVGYFGQLLSMLVISGVNPGYVNNVQGLVAAVVVT